MPTEKFSRYNDVIISTMTSQITSLTIVYPTVYSRRRSKKHQSSASLAFVRGIHRWPVNSLHKGPVTRKMFTFDDVIMSSHAPLVFNGSVARLWTRWRHSKRPSKSHEILRRFVCCLRNPLAIASRHTDDDDVTISAKLCDVVCLQCCNYSRCVCFYNEVYVMQLCK